MSNWKDNSHWVLSQSRQHWEIKTIILLAAVYYLENKRGLLNLYQASKSNQHLYEFCWEAQKHFPVEGSSKNQIFDIFYIAWLDISQALYL